MEIILELIFGVVFEAFLGLFGEILFELGFNSLAGKFSDRTGRKILTGIAYAIVGFVLGGLSVKVLPPMTVGGTSIAVAYFIFAPLIAGLALCLVNWLLRRDIDQPQFFQLSKFLHGVIFVFFFSGARAVFA